MSATARNGRVIREVVESDRCQFSRILTGPRTGWRLLLSCGHTVERQQYDGGNASCDFCPPPGETRGVCSTCKDYTKIHARGECGACYKSHSATEKADILMSFVAETRALLADLDACTCGSARFWR